MNNCKYVRKKLQETIDYWERQLSEGNYKKEPTRKQILETIKYWENELRNPNSKRVLNEGWLGGILGVLLSPFDLLGSLCFGPIGILIGWAAGGYAGHKIQEWFHKRNAVKNMTDESLLMLAAAKGAGAKGVGEDIVEQLKSNGVKIDTIDDLVRIGALKKTGSTYKITTEGKNILDDAGYDEAAMKKTGEQIQKDAKKAEKNGEKPASLDEDVQFKYFIQMYSCYADGTPSDFDLSEIGYECEESYQKFDSKSRALAVAKHCSKKAHEARVAEAYEDAECTPENAPEFMKHILEDCHVIAIVKYGDEYENSICGYFIDGKPTNVPLSKIVQHYEK